MTDSNNFHAHRNQIKHLLTERKIVDVSRRGARKEKEGKK